MNHNDHARSARFAGRVWVLPGKRSSRTGELLRDSDTSDGLVVHHVAS